MEMVLLDWTRMAKAYCLAGVVIERDRIRVVRPLLTKHRGANGNRVGWSAYLLDGHGRWELFKLIGVEPASCEPPHSEDVWVRALQPLRRQAPSELRRRILEATIPSAVEALFGAPLATTRTAAFVSPGAGTRSLTTLLVPAQQMTFGISWRQGMAEPDVRVQLPLPEVGVRTLAVKDHHLLCHAERAFPDVAKRATGITELVRQMGANVAVRLGLSRAFSGDSLSSSPSCWVMADGFFSPTDPQP